MLAFGAVAGLGQAVSNPPTASGGKNAEEEPVVLSPFEVTSSSDVGYEATETLSGSRMNMQLKDVSSQVHVMTKEFMDDLGIINLQDAMSYSMNMEGSDLSIDATNANAGFEDTTGGPTAGGVGRMRSLATPNFSQDFFDTFIRSDNYNIERYTFSSGPNAILFGNSSPSGTVDSSPIRALLTRQKYAVTYRIDDNGSNRVSTDLNVPLVKRHLGLRLAGLHDRNHDWRQPAFRNEDRLYASLVFQPIDKLSIRAYYEGINSAVDAVRNTLVQDHVTPWILAGRPAFDNGGGLTAAFPATTGTSPFVRAVTQPTFLVLSPNGVVSVGQQGNTVKTKGFDTALNASGATLDAYEHSIVDSGLFPLDRSFSGNSDGNRMRAGKYGLIANANPFKNFYVEVGYNRERFKQRGVDSFNNAAAELNVDQNRYLNDRVTPNPNFGRYFFDNDQTNIINLRNYGEKEQKRLSLSYELNFTNRRNWMKWLGRYQAALMFDKLNTMNSSRQQVPRVMGDGYSFPTDTANRTLVLRYYIDPAHPSVYLPFDPYADGIVTVPGAFDANGKPLQIAAWDPSIPGGAITVNRTLSSSRSVSLQSYLLNDRVVVSYGQRRDNNTFQNSQGLVSSWDYFSTFDGDITWLTNATKSSTKPLKGIVIHPLSWLSARYSESGSQIGSTLARTNLDGTAIPLGAGTGKNYGITLRLGSRLSLQVDRYEDSSVGGLASIRSLLPTATFAGRGNQLRRELSNLERAAQIYESTDRGNPVVGSGATATGGTNFTRSEKYAYYQDFLTTLSPAGNVAGSNDINNRFDLISDRVAKGYEVKLAGNPAPGWRVALTGAKNQTRESNVAPQYFDFFLERLPVYAKYLNRTFLPLTQNAQFGQILNATIQGFNFARLSQGQLNAAERKYRLTFTTSYRFNTGRLKGLSAGMNYSWRSGAAVGYQKITISDNPFIVPGLTGASTVVDDVKNPIRGGAITTFDMFLGYSRRLPRFDKVQWRVQLNIRNLLDKQDLLLQQASLTGITGFGALYTMQAPRLFTLTNTFEY